ncbi:MAG: Flagellar hook protein FlgE [bacterium ADurb.Bin236]|nr:MAG: Flagellar hook protein FlgE [bacterium ADurb.Bin236]
MNSSFYTGVLGLKNHQTRMDVIGNNIANVNTYGFKMGRATFADLLSRTYSSASSPRNGRGGTNPLQVGLGVTTAAVTNIMTQGQLETTGRLTDVAVNGNGWFVLQDGSGSTVYTRDGSFGLDKEGSLVNANGLYVQGWSRVLVDEDHNFSIDTQRPVENISFVYGEKLEAAATTQVALACNLDETSRSLIADGVDPKEGWATKNDLLVDLYESYTNQYSPTHLGIREGDWIEINVNTLYQNQQTLGVSENILTSGTTITYSGVGTVQQYSGLADPTELPMTNIALTGGLTRVFMSPQQLAALGAGSNLYTIDEGSGVIYSTEDLTGETLSWDVQSSAESTMPYNADKYLYFQVTNDTTIGNLETAIQNALNAADINGTLNATVKYNSDEAKFYIYNNGVDGTGNFNSITVNINAVSGSGIRQAFMLQDSTYPTLTGTRLGITQGGLGNAMTREHVGNFDYQTNNLTLDYGDVNGSAQIYGQVVRSFLTATGADMLLDAGTGFNYIDINDWTGYTNGGTLGMIADTEELTVNGTTWRNVSSFTGAANEYHISTSATGVPRVYFNNIDSVQPAAAAPITFSYRTQTNGVTGAPNLLLTENVDYTIDAATGNISLIWSGATASAVFGAGGADFTGTISLTADYTTEQRSLTPPAEIMNSRWADFAQEWQEVSAGGAGNARTEFNNMFSSVNGQAINDQATSAQPTSKVTKLFNSAETYRTSIDVYDSLGDAHTLQFIFTHVGSNYDLTELTSYQNRWYWRAELPYDDVFSFDSMDAVDGISSTAKLSGELVFDNNGLINMTRLSGNTGPIMFDPSPVGANGASSRAVAALSIEAVFDGFDSPIDGVTQYASQFTTRAYMQNGWEMGVLETFGVDKSGVIQGKYSNNVVKPIAQIALAMFANEEGLTKLGDNEFSISANTGSAHIVPAYVAGAGEIVGGTLEQSNVDIVNEFTNMIITERGFQANSRIITTSDEMLVEVLNIKR